MRDKQVTQPQPDTTEIPHSIRRPTIRVELVPL